MEEVITLNVIPITRPTPAGITAELDKETFIAYVSGAGTYTLSYSGSAWSATLSDYGVTVSGTPEDGDSITITWDGEADPEMTVSSPRTPDSPITATINKATFRAKVTESGTTNLYYTTEWSEDPTEYGITVTGTPTAGDSIVGTYVKEVRARSPSRTRRRLLQQAGIFTITQTDMRRSSNTILAIVLMAHTLNCSSQQRWLARKPISPS